MNQYVNELFYFYPEKQGYNSAEIEQVHLIGEFNMWGVDTKNLNKYQMIKDKTGRWIGLFSVPKGRGAYKFLLNKKLYCPYMGHMYYSTVTTPDWAKKAIWYQIMVDRFYNADPSVNPQNLIPWDSPPDYFNNFGGDLKGIRKKIPYLKNLFGTLKNKALYLNPLHTSFASNHKYWPEDFNSIDPQFGTEEDLQDLINDLHKEGAKIINDLVYNHTGLNHYAFIDVLKNGCNSEYINWFRGLPLPHEKIEIPILEKHLGDKPQNITIENDPRTNAYISEKESYISVWNGKYKFPINNPQNFKNASVDEIINNQKYYKLVPLHEKPNYHCWWNLFEIPELNARSEAVKRHLFDATRKWVRMGVDGFRLDVPNCINSAQEFWAEFREEIRQESILNDKNPDDLYVVGEIWFGGEATGSYLYGNDKAQPIRFDAIMNYPIRENILNFLSGDMLQYAHDAVVGAGEISVTEMDKNLHNNLGYISWGTDQAQYNVFSSHDTRRLRTALKDDDRKLKGVLTMEFTLPGAPAIYYGDEIGLKGDSDPACRETMKWDIIDNLLKHPEEDEIFNLYKNLIKLRDNTSCLVEGALYTLICDNHDKIYSYARHDHNNSVIVIVAKNEINHDLTVNISKMPFENIVNWNNPITEKEYINYGKEIRIKSEDFKNNCAVILKSQF